MSKFKKKAVRVTEKNLPAIYGRLVKFFNSVKKTGAQDFEICKWTGKEPIWFYNTFYGSELELEKERIQFILPVITEMKIGDRIYMDGNIVIIQQIYYNYNKTRRRFEYQVYRRITQRRYDVCK
jgi:hypothetical protein